MFLDIAPQRATPGQQGAGSANYQQIVATAIAEDADGIGLSILSGAHMTLFQAVLEQLRENGAGDSAVFGGGIIPEADIPKLTEMGVAHVFTPGTRTDEIVDWVRQNVAHAA